MPLIKKDLKEIKDTVVGGLDDIEKLILADHKRRIEKLEFEVRELKDLLAVK